MHGQIINIFEKSSGASQPPSLLLSAYPSGGRGTPGAVRGLGRLPACWITAQSEGL